MSKSMLVANLKGRLTKQERAMGKGFADIVRMGNSASVAIPFAYSEGYMSEAFMDLRPVERDHAVSLFSMWLREHTGREWWNNGEYKEPIRRAEWLAKVREHAVESQGTKLPYALLSDAMRQENGQDRLVSGFSNKQQQCSQQWHVKDKCVRAFWAYHYSDRTMRETSQLQDLRLLGGMRALILFAVQNANEHLDNFNEQALQETNHEAVIEAVQGVIVQNGGDASEVQGLFTWGGNTYYTAPASLALCDCLHELSNGLEEHIVLNDEEWYRCEESLNEAAGYYKLDLRACDQNRNMYLEHYNPEYICWRDIPEVFEGECPFCYPHGLDSEEEANGESLTEFTLHKPAMIDGQDLVKCNDCGFVFRNDPPVLDVSSIREKLAYFGHYSDEEGPFEFYSVEGSWETCEHGAHGKIRFPGLPELSATRSGLAWEVSLLEFL